MYGGVRPLCCDCNECVNGVESERAIHIEKLKRMQKGYSFVRLVCIWYVSGMYLVSHQIARTPCKFVELI